MSLILVVDDEQSVCINLKKFFEKRGFVVEVANDGETAIAKCESMPIDLVLLDLKLPDTDGLEILKRIKSLSSSTGVIIITAHGDIQSAVQAMRLKADNFVPKPVDMYMLELMVERTLDSYRTYDEMKYLKQRLSQLEGSAHLSNLRHPPDVYHAIMLLAGNSSTNILILGETGTGKGIVAKTIHHLSDRRNYPFIDINCAGLSTELLESELFGHEKGAFTDAKECKKGLLEIGNKGTLFLDEVAELSLPVQAKLLKVIEEKTFRRLGGTVNIDVDIRIIAATNTNLEDAVKKGRFRKDLYFRLNVIPIHLPPLRDRRDDIIPLAEGFLKEFSNMFGKEVSRFSPAAESILLYYNWPGNIRELKNAIERAVLLCESDEIQPHHLPQNLRCKNFSPVFPLDKDCSLETMEKKHIEKVLAVCGFNRSKTAKMLGIHRTTLLKKLKKYNLEIDKCSHSRQ